MMNKKGGMDSPLNMSLAIVGIITLILLFSLGISFVPKPKDVIMEMEVDTYGNIFLNNFLRYEVDYEGSDYMISELIMIYHGNYNKDIKNIVESRMSNILKQMTGMDNPCFTLRIDNVKEFGSQGSCEKNKVESSMVLPYNDRTIKIGIKGE